MPVGTDYEVDDPGFKAWVRSSGGGGAGPRGGGGSGGGGGFPTLGGSSVLGTAAQGGVTGGLMGALRRRRVAGFAGALMPSSAMASLPVNAQGLSTTPTMSIYGTAAGGRTPTPMPVRPMVPGGGGGAPGGGFGGKGGGVRPGGHGGGPGGGGGAPGGGGGGTPASVEWNPEALVKWLMSNAEKSGVFDVNGNPMLARMARENIMGDAGARESAARTQAIMRAGNDPSMAGFASLMSGLNTAGQASGAASDAALKSAYDNQAFMRDLVSRFAGPKQEQQGGTNWADLLGPIAGALIGAL